jgi:hypothetical protein
VKVISCHLIGEVDKRVALRACEMDITGYSNIQRQIILSKMVKKRSLLNFMLGDV